VSAILGKVTGYNDHASRDSLMRRFERDKKVLRDMGIPIEHKSSGPFGVEGYRIPRDAYFLDEISLPPESGKILRALFAWAHAGGGSLSEDLRSALVKLGFFVDEEGSEERPVLPRESLDPMVGGKPTKSSQAGENLELLSQAVFHNRRVRFTYRTMSSGEELTRVVDPYGLGFAGQAWNRGAWYLVGYCHLREAQRVFKLQRIKGAVDYADPGEGPDYTIPAGFRVREHIGKTRWEYKNLETAFTGGASEPFQAEIGFAAGVSHEVRSLVPSAEVVSEHENWVTLRFQVHQRRPFLRFLLRYVPRIRIATPPDLEGALRDLAREVLAQYRGQPGGGSA
ncbi:MAG: WYL domain-containing protein, partial [Planctomycetes bacterium]|nr:WYL domain-containing protein [Planctomycetota bacterium]